MIQILGLILISFFITSIFLVPFIDFLFYLRKRFKKPSPLGLDTNSPLHNVILKGKDVDTPVGGGLLLIPIIIILPLLIFLFSDLPINNEFYILVFTVLSFSLIGLLDDFRKIFTAFSGKFAGMRGRYILLLQVFFAFIVALILYSTLSFNNVFIPFFGNIVLDFWYIPLAMLPIIAFSNAYNISDGLDGLSSGLLTICLIAFLVLANSVFNQTLSVFVGVWLGALLAYLYFNIYPARIYLGDAASFSFGATLAVVGLLTGKIVALGVIGGVFGIIVTSSFLQIASKKLFGKKLFPIAPVHMFFKYIGWEEPKIVMRFWILGAIFAILGLWLALLSK